MAPKQTCIRFEHPCGVLSSSQWRQALLPEHAQLLQDVAVHQSSTALSFTAMAPQASDRMRDGALALMRAVAGLAGKTLSVEMPEFTPSSALTGYRWQYEIPAMVVARSGEEWGGWRQPQMDDQHQSKLRERILADLTRQLALWELAAHELNIELVHAGVPMPLKDAVTQGPKPTSAMARKKVLFSSSVRIEGAFWAGRLQATGHGRIYRAGYQNQE